MVQIRTWDELLANDAEPGKQEAVFISKTAFPPGYLENDSSLWIDPVVMRMLPERLNDEGDKLLRTALTILKHGTHDDDIRIQKSPPALLYGFQLRNQQYNVKCHVNNNARVFQIEISSVETPPRKLLLDLNRARVSGDFLSLQSKRPPNSPLEQHLRENTKRLRKTENTADPAVALIAKLDLDRVPEHVRTPIERALAAHKLAVAERLLEEETQAPLDETTLASHWENAIEGGHSDWICALLALSPPEQIETLYRRDRNEDGFSLLHRAFDLNHAGINNVIREYPYLISDLYIGEQDGVEFPDGSPLACQEKSVHWAHRVFECAENAIKASNFDLASLAAAFDPELFKKKNLPTIVPRTLTDGTLHLRTTANEEHYVSPRKWNVLGRQQCRELDKNPWPEGKAGLRFKVFGAMTSAHAVATAFLVAMNENGEKTYSYFSHDPNNQFLMRVAITRDIDATDKWTFHFGLQVEEDASEYEFDESPELIVMEYRQEAVEALWSGRPLEPVPSALRRVQGIIDDNREFTPTMLTHIFCGGLERALRDLKPVFRQQIENRPPDQVEALLLSFT